MMTINFKLEPIYKLNLFRFLFNSLGWICRFGSEDIPILLSASIIIHWCVFNRQLLEHYLIVARNSLPQFIKLIADRNSKQVSSSIN